MTHRLQVKPKLRLVEKKKPTRKSWTQADYRHAQHTAKQEYLLKELVNKIMATNFTVEELADHSNISASTIKRWLRGDTKQAITRTLTAVGRVLGGKLGWEWRI